MNPFCPYCKNESKLVKGDVIYPWNEKLHARSYYHCVPCKAWVGCHPNSIEPLGRLADAELRAARVSAHKAFDPIWRNNAKRNKTTNRNARTKAYVWLAVELGILLRDCHIGLFDKDTCKRVVEICRRR